MSQRLRCLKKLGGLSQSLVVYGLDIDMLMSCKTLERRKPDRGTVHTSEGNIRFRWQPREGHKGCTSQKEGILMEAMVGSSCKHAP